MSGTLTTCNNFDQMFCIIKLIEAILSFALLCFCMVQLVIEFKIKGRITINTKISIQILIALSLLFNVLHCIFDPQRIILFVHLFFTNIFYVTIFYYVGDNVLQGRVQKIVIIAFYVLMVIVYFIIMILRILFSSRMKCTTSLYLIVDIFTLLLSVLIFALYYRKNQQENKIHQFYSNNLIHVPKSERTSSLSTPFMRMWILIITYIICGVVNFLQTVLLFTVYSQTCQFTSNQNLDTLYKFLFDVFDYYIGCLITLIILRKMRLAQTPRQADTNERSRELSFSNGSVLESNKLQLIANLSVSQRNSSLD